MAKYYVCSICGNLVEMVNDEGNTPSCCGRSMRALAPASTDGSVEKHVPVVELISLCDNDSKEAVTKVIVSVGSTPHPAEPNHYIEWIALETNKGMHRVHLTAECQPHATFYLGPNETIVATYAYCNLHGLWKG